MASNISPRRGGAVLPSDPRNPNMASSSSFSSSQTLVDDRTKFLELRKTFSHLRTLINATYPTYEHNKYANDQAIKDEIKKVTETLAHQFENVCSQMKTHNHTVVAGQKSIGEGVTRVEHMVRQISDGELHRLTTMLMEEQRVKAEMQCKLESKQREVEELKNRVHEAEIRAAVNSKENGQLIKQFHESLADLKQDFRTQSVTPASGGFGPRYTQRLRSRSCDELDTVEHGLYMSPSESCFTLDDLNLSRESDEVCGHGYRHGLARHRALTRSTTTIDTKDTGFSDASTDTNEAIRILQLKIDKLLESAVECPKPPAPGPELPVFIRGFCVNIQELVFSSDKSRINQFSRSLGVDRDRLQSLKDHWDYRRDLPSLFWALIYEWNSLCETRGTRATMLNQLIQACDDCRISNPLDVKPMPTKDRLIVEKKYSYLVEHLMVQQTLVYLRDSQFLTPNIVSYVLEPDPEPEKVLRLVDILPACGHNALDIFVLALRQSHQGHIADEIVSSHPNRFTGNHGAASSSRPVEDSYTLFPCQDLQTKRRRRFNWKKPFRIFKSKTYKMNQDY